MQGSTTPLFIELFAGRGSLSRAALQAGFSVLSVDHEGHDPVVPIIQLDLTTESGEAILWDMLDSKQLWQCTLACHAVQQALRESDLSLEICSYKGYRTPAFALGGVPVGATWFR